MTRRSCSPRAARRARLGLGLSPSLALLAVFSIACAAAPAADKPGAEIVPADALPHAQALSALQEEVKAIETLDGPGLIARFPAPVRDSLSFDATKAEFIDRIQASSLALDDQELELLGQSGVLISGRQVFPTFLRGYAAIYMEHLPVFVSADAILNAVHRSFDKILFAFEARLLRDDLGAMLGAMQEALAGAGGSEVAKRDASLYLGVARRLLAGPEAPATDQRVEELAVAAEAATGTDAISLFGVNRDIDFSQFTPRGHYVGRDELETYFRAMIWLGRIDLRIVETMPDGGQVFRRDQYEAALLLNEVLSGRALELWRGIDQVVRLFVGESDYMTPDACGALIEDLGGLELARAAADADVVRALAAGGYGEQQIASHLMVNDGTSKTLPLNRSYAILGQRYVVDSHVFSETVYDRVADRLMPNPLDAAFAALGNNAALAFQPEIVGGQALPGALGRMRHLIDAHPEDFWQANLYNLWLSALRALSLQDQQDGVGLPEVAQTKAWSRRVLNTQLASWAELRHDTLLYAKQSYSGIPACDFPDAYVEPYPEFFRALVRYAEAGVGLVDLAARDDVLGSQVASYFDNLKTAAEWLAQMAEQQRQGEPYTEEQLAFINDAVRVDKEDVVCTTVDLPNGWYARLFYEASDSIEMDLTIADVHTQPADWGGALVGRVLHAATGTPRLMVATVDTCMGPRAYVGMASAYHELVSENFKRFTDEEWQQLYLEAGAPDVPWLEGVLSHPATGQP